MHPGVLVLPFVFVLGAPQAPTDSFRRHYEAAETRRRAGDSAGAEGEYGAIVADASHELGRVLTVQGRYADAVAALEAAQRLNPNADDVVVDLAIARFHVGKFQEAAESLERVVKRDPRQVGARHMLGKCRFMLGDFAAATAELREALRLAPGDYDVAYTLGIAYLKQRQLPQAKAIFTRMIARLGDRPQLRVLIGRAYRETGFLDAAVVELRRAVVLDPKFPRVHYYLGLTYLLRDGAAKLDEAAAEFRIELASHPDEYFANYYLGILSNIGRDWPAAITLLERASAAQPQNPDPYFHLGQAYQGAERHDRAVEVLRRSIALTTDPARNDYQVATAHYRLGQSLLKLGQQDEGERELQVSADLKASSLRHDEAKTETYLSAESLHQSAGEGVIAEPDAPDAATAAGLAERAAYLSKVLAAAYNSIGLARAERGDFLGAAERFDEARRWNPDQEGLDFNLGLARYKAGRYADSIPALEREVAARPQNLAAKQLLGMSCFATEDFGRAADLLGEVAASKPGDTSLLYPLALALEKVGRAEAASAVVARMLATGGDSPQVHVLLGQAYAEQGDDERALGELRAALALDPKAPDAHFFAGMLFVKSGKFEDAAREFRAELAANPADVRTRYHLGYALVSGGDTQEGLRVLREVVSVQPSHADARYELGKALLQSGDVGGAIEQLEAAARIDPEKPHVHYQLGRAYVAAGRQTDGERELEVARKLNDKARAKAGE
jgi:tetratricopeptide (TPR) repeat protein